MNQISPKIRNLARHLINLEGAQVQKTDQQDGGGVLAVFAKLQESLLKLTGTLGYVSLLLRASALAKAKAPSLNEITIGPDGSLSGLEKLKPDAGEAFVAELLGLLVTFIGKSLTLSIVHEIWPDAKLE
jgi:hypothetical protein